MPYAANRRITGSNENASSWHFVLCTKPPYPILGKASSVNTVWDRKTVFNACSRQLQA